MKVAAKVLLFLISWLVWNGYDYGMSKSFLPMPHKQISKFALKQQFQRPIEKEHSLCRPISRLSSQIVFLHSHLLSCENGRDGTSQVIYWTRKSPNRLPFRLPLLTIWKSPAYSILICWKLQALSKLHSESFRSSSTVLLHLLSFLRYPIPLWGETAP